MVQALQGQRMGCCWRTPCPQASTSQTPHNCEHLAVPSSAGFPAH
jgi:hypothetical protein